MYVGYRVSTMVVNLAPNSHNRSSNLAKTHQTISVNYFTTEKKLFLKLILGIQQF